MSIVERLRDAPKDSGALINQRTDDVQKGILPSGFI